MISIPKLPPFKRFCITIGAIPTTYIESLSYYETLLWLCKYLQDTVIPAINTNAEAVTELQTAFETLQSYVDNYFENLDVQEEINNKLDQMASDGTLTELITEYLQLSGMLTYNSIADMKASTNLIDGSTAQTLGYYSYNDGGGAIYKIREILNTDVVDDQYIVAIGSGNLIAELIINDGSLNIKSIGGKPDDNTFDNSLIISKAITKAITDKNYSTIYLPSGYYYCSTPIDFTDTDIYSINIVGDSQNYRGTDTGTVIEYTGSNDTYLFNFDVFNRSSIKDINIVGTNRNNILSINEAYFSTIENVQMGNYLNGVWIKNKSGYLFFNNCGFGNTVTDSVGVIINQHYIDGRVYDSTNNTEYIYFNECSMDSHNSNGKAIVIYGGEFIYINKCDICNSSADGVITLDSTGWGGILLDISIDDCSFVRNTSNIKMTSGTGASGRISIDGHFTRPSSPQTTDKIVTIDGTNTTFSYVKLSGIIDDYSNTNSIVLTKTYNFVNDLIGNYGNITRSNDNATYITARYNIDNVPDIRRLTPSVSVSGNTVNYDFSSVLNIGDTGLLVCSGLIGGASSSCYICGEVYLASGYEQKLKDYTGTNLTSVVWSNQTLSIGCAYTPSDSLANLKFTLYR